MGWTSCECSDRLTTHTGIEDEHENINQNNTIPKRTMRLSSGIHNSPPVVAVAVPVSFGQNWNKANEGTKDHTVRKNKR